MSRNAFTRVIYMSQVLKPSLRYRRTRRSALASREANLQTRVWLQRGHLGIPAVVVDGVSLRHPQRRTLPQRERRQEDHKPDPSAPNEPTEDIRGFSLERDSILQPSNQTLVLHTDHKRSQSSVSSENWLQFNYFCSVIQIYSRVITSETPYFQKPVLLFFLINPL